MVIPIGLKGVEAIMIEIYADMVFLINWVMDLFIFWITGLLVKKKAKKWRLVLGSAVAALMYCVLVFMPVIRNYYNFFSSLIVLLSGILVTFGLKDIKEFMKLVIMAHISAFAVGGIGSALFYYANITDVIGNAIGFTMNYFSFKTLIAAVCVSYIVIKASIVIFNKMAMRKQAIYNVRIACDTGSVEIPALVDTGNTLVDPVSKMPVIIGEFESIRALLPQGLQKVFADGCENDLSLIINAVSGGEMEKSIRMIPFKSLGNENGMLIGFKPTAVEIDKENETITLNNIIVGIYNLELTKGGEYRGLLSPQVLNTEN